MYFLNINKPKGISSFDVIRQLRKFLKIKAIGHSGTLDPLASGVMQVGVGACTKLLDFLNSDKEYIASIKFGYTSDTYDAEGNVTFVQRPEFSKNDLNKTLKSFIGKTMQIPPKFSAIKQNGTKLCDIARKQPNQVINIKPREIEIYDIQLLKFNDFDEAKIKVNCKKGTYIRSLIYDIGNTLGCGAYMSDLVRTKAGDFTLENSDELSYTNYRKINPIDVLPFDKKELSSDEFKKVINGNQIINNQKYKTELILLTKNNKLVSIAKISDNFIKPKKVFNEGLE